MRFGKSIDGPGGSQMSLEGGNDPMNDGFGSGGPPAANKMQIVFGGDYGEAE